MTNRPGKCRLFETFARGDNVLHLASITTLAAASAMGKKQRVIKENQLAPQFPPEERSTEVATIGWMLCALYTLVAEVIGVIAKALLVLHTNQQAESLPLRLLVYCMLITGLVSGGLSLALTPVVYRLRRTPPPTVIALFVALVALTPFVSLLILWARGSL